MNNRLDLPLGVFSRSGVRSTPPEERAEMHQLGWCTRHGGSDYEGACAGIAGALADKPDLIRCQLIPYSHQPPDHFGDGPDALAATRSPYSYIVDTNTHSIPEPKACTGEQSSRLPPAFSSSRIHKLLDRFIKHVDRIRNPCLN